MNKHLHAVMVIAIFFFSLFDSPVFSQNRVDVGKSYANISKLLTGGTFNPGDTIEVRVTIAVKTVGTFTAVDSVQVFDNVPAKTTYIPGSLRIATSPHATERIASTSAPAGSK